MMREFLAWWAESMTALVPRPLREWTAQRGSAVVVTVEPGAEPAAVEVALRRNQRERALGRFPLDGAGAAALRGRLSRAKPPGMAILRVGRDWLLEREVALPIAAEREAARVLSYELDRLTPFAPGEVYWGWGVERRDRAQGRVHLRLSIVPRAGLRPVLEMLQAAGIAPRALEAANDAGALRLIPLDAEEAAGTRLSRLAPRVAIAGCVLLAVVAVALPFVRQAIDRAAVEDRIQMLQPRVAEAETLRRRIAGNAAGSDVIAAERARLGDPLHVIATVTEILPDDTFLTELQLHKGRLGLAGQSAAAARLIPALAAEPTFRNPAFIAPVTRVENGQSDVFSIAADVGPER